MSNPYDQFDTGNPYDQFDAKSVATPVAQSQQPSTYDQWIGRPLGLTARAVIQGVNSMPAMAADAGVAVRNYLPNAPDWVYKLNQRIAGALPEGKAQDIASAVLPQGPMKGYYGLPSAGYNQALNATGLPEPVGLGEKIGSFGVSVLAGSKMPSPTAANQAPANFVRTTPRTETLIRSQNEGYVIPPSTTNPTVPNQLLESIGGKTGMEQDARAINTYVSNRLGSRAFNLADNAAPTLDELAQVRNNVAPAYNAMRSLGEVKPDQKFTDALQGLVQSQKGAGEAFGGPFKESALNPYIEALTSKESFSADAAVEATKILRSEADRAFAAGDKALGGSFKQASNAIEGLLERTGEAQGQSGLVDAFRAARQTIAQTYSAGKAVNEAAGTFSAPVMARQLAKGVPLTGDLRTVGEFGQAFPRVAAPLLDSGSVRNTDMMMGGGAALLSGHAAPLTWPLLRMAIREYLLSSAGQARAIPQTWGGVSPSVLMGTQAGVQSLATR